MNQSFYAASVAVSQQQKRLNVTANNLANVNNAGFKAEKIEDGEHYDYLARISYF